MKKIKFRFTRKSLIFFPVVLFFVCLSLAVSSKYIPFFYAKSILRVESLSELLNLAYDVNIPNLPDKKKDFDEYFKVQTSLADSEVFQAWLKKQCPEVANIQMTERVKSAPVKGANLIELTVLGLSPEEAAKLSRIVAEGFIEYNEYINVKKASDINSFLTLGIDKYNAMLKKGLSEINKLNAGFPPVEDIFESYETDIMNLSEKKIELIKSESRLENLAIRYTEEHPAVKKAISRINKLNAEISMIEKKLNSRVPVEQLYKMRELKDIKIKNNVLKLTQQAINDAENQKFKNIYIEKVPDEAEVHIRIIAVFSVVFIGAVIGLLVGAFIYVIRTNRDPIIVTPEDLESAFSERCLGVIPSLMSNVNWLSRYLEYNTHPRSVAAQSLKNICEKITGNISSAGKTYVFCSPIRNAGVTVALTNLSAVLADKGMKVLIVDCGKRSSVFSQTLGVKGEEEVPGYRGDGSSKLSDSYKVRGTKVQGISVAQVAINGSTDKNNIDESAEKFINEAKKAYDIILVHLTFYEEIRSIRNTFDKVIVVVRSGYASLSSLMMLKKFLLNEKIYISGVILNDVKTAEGDHYYNAERFYKG